ncbi:hypothetical protein [Tenacibaculum jejuense]|uniref:Probable lipoprotein n=1 Tax=Tenacibaculum jejuense TaxID=584609 RepID=A0A238UGJ6_9FLAO|nr:hypothetical protein [Tenacibaculum jejuense]SNR17544.1 Probable lipoprotein precursor [Tenacibaculum jejuense]
MHSKWILIVTILLFSCSKDEKSTNLSNTILSDFLLNHSDKVLDEVIACAGSSNNEDAVLVYYFPEEGSFDFKYYETESANVNPDDFSNYKLKNLSIEGVFGNKLSAFKRNELQDAWGIVTYQTEGKIHKSNPIRIKHTQQATVYNSDVTIDTSVRLSPEFRWNESELQNDAIYFQVLLEHNSIFVSGTYTFDRFFRYYDTSNVVLTINPTTPPKLEIANDYQFIVLGVSLDNWVNSYSYKNFTAE